MFFIPKADLDNTANKLSKDADMFNNASILVTGGTGFIGKWLVATLNQLDLNEELNINIHILTRNKKKFTERFPECLNKKNVQFIESDIRNLDINNLGLDFDYIILGANDATYDFSLNAKELYETLITGTFNLLETVVTSKTKSIIQLSSGAVYGDISSHKDGAKESDLSLMNINNIGSMYGLSKAIVESILNQFGAQNNINIFNARCFAFVGPYLPVDKHFAIGNFINDCINSSAITINGNGLPIRSYMYAADMARAILLCLSSKKSMAINIGSDKKISIIDLANLVSKSLNKQQVIVRNIEGAHPEKANYYLPNISLLKSLGFEESFSLETSIKQTFNFYS